MTEVQGFTPLHMRTIQTCLVKAIAICEFSYPE